MLRTLRNLDHLTKAFILVAITGIGASLWFLYSSSMGGGDIGSGEKIAELKRSVKDIRVKRSGTLSWYEAAEKVNFYNKDLVFTGKESFATILFQDGTEVKLLPNSLISLSEGRLSLDSGTIEIEHAGKANFTIESYGEKIELKEKAKVRFVNKKKVKRIVNLAPTPLPIQKVTKLQEYFKEPELTILKPTVGDLLPKFPGKNIPLGWKWDGTGEASFVVELSSDRNFTSNPLKLSTKEQNLRVPVDQLPAGTTFWRVTEVSTGKKITANFILSGDVIPKLITPTDNSSFPFEKAKDEGVLFSWTNSLGLSQRIEVARDQNFAELLLNEETNKTSSILKIASNGTYFWRVGYAYDGGISWANVASFVIEPQIVLVPIAFVSFPEKLDFSLEKSYVIEFHDMNGSISYGIALSRDGKELFRKSTTKQKVLIEALNNGVYQLEVVGTLANGKTTPAAKKSFVVQNSPPVKPPKLKKLKKANVFVKLLKKSLDLLFPEAIAQVAEEDKYLLLEWEGGENESYEIEVREKGQQKPFVKKNLSDTSFKLKLPGPGVYEWRVRTKSGSRWSAFSEYSEIDAKDSISLIGAPLMISPANRAEIPSKEKIIEFRWKEPSPEYRYFLELYAPPKQKPYKVKEVKNGKYRIRFKRRPNKIYWRVFAESPYGKRTTNTEVYRIDTPKEVAKVIEKKPAPVVTKPANKEKVAPKITAKSQHLFRLNIAYGQREVNQNYSDPSVTDLPDSLTLTGPLSSFRYEYYPHWLSSKILSLNLRQGNFSGESSTLEELGYGLEFGWALGDKKNAVNNFLIGVQSQNVEFDLADVFAAEYSLLFLSLRHYYSRMFRQNWAWEVESLFQVPIIEMSPSFSVRPQIAHRMGDNWWLKGFVGFERIAATPELESSQSSEDVDIVLQSFFVGVGITWTPEGLR